MIRVFIFVFMCPLLLCAQQRDTVQYKTTTYYGINSSIGWSTNYNSTLYGCNSPAQLFSTGAYFGFNFSRKTLLNFGLRYSSVWSWDSDIDSSFYSTSGFVTFKDARYAKKSISPFIGLSILREHRNYSIAGGISLSRPMWGSVSVHDFISDENSSLLSFGSMRGISAEFNMNLGYHLNEKIRFWLMYSILWMHERTVFKSNSPAAEDNAFSYNGIFNSIGLTITYKM